MPFCTQCGSGVSGESCSNCGAENPHFRDPSAEPEIALAPSVFAPVESERPRPWGLIESSLALAWPRMRKNAIWAVVVIAINLLVTIFMSPKVDAILKSSTTPAKLGHLYAQFAPLLLVAIAISIAIRLMALGEAARARTPEFRWRLANTGALIAWWFLAGIGLSIVIAIASTLILIPVVLTMIPHIGSAAAPTVSPQSATMVPFLAFAVMIPMLMWLGTKIALLEYSFVLGERSNPIGASWKLTGGYFWETLGFYLLYIFVGIGIFVVSVGVRALLASLNKSLVPIGDFLQIFGSVWLQFALAEGMFAWTVMLREAKAVGRQG